jgi:ribosome-associated translation inhibitor RaiA
MMNELEFTIEFNSPLDNSAEVPLLDEAAERLRDLAKGHTDVTGAAINIRRPAKGKSGYLYEATVAVYVRPEQVSATEKNEDPLIALKGALTAAERQIRKRRDKLRKHWELPGNHPVEQEMMELLMAEVEDEDSE